LWLGTSAGAGFLELTVQATYLNGANMADQIKQKLTRKLKINLHKYKWPSFFQAKTPRVYLRAPEAFFVANLAEQGRLYT